MIEMKVHFAFFRVPYEILQREKSPLSSHWEHITQSQQSLIPSELKYAELCTIFSIIPINTIKMLKCI